MENEFVFSADVPSVYERLASTSSACSDWKRCTAQARELHPDVVLMNPVLKGKMDGMEVAHSLRRFDISVIFLTAGVMQPRCAVQGRPRGTLSS